MNNIKVLGKFLDQPILVSKFQKAVPIILASGALGYSLYDASKAKEGKNKKQLLKTGITMGVTVASALAAPHIASKITKRALPETLDIIKKNNIQLIDEFKKNTIVDETTNRILEKGKEKILNLKEVKTLYEKLKNTNAGKSFLEKLIPSPENINAKDIFSEIGYLSIYGAVPVVGGIIGGSLADRVTDKNGWKEKIPNKIKEGSYQYLANIFMCNVGAGCALGIMEKLRIKSKKARAIGMTLGIIITGIIGGSKIANLIGKNVIDPICTKEKSKKEKINSYDILDINFSERKIHEYLHNQTIGCGEGNTKKSEKERTPEILDIGLHTDDIATVSLLSGLKWIEPALPIMYTLSGYRAGIGYRN